SNPGLYRGMLGNTNPEMFGDIPQAMLPETYPDSIAGFQRTIIPDCIPEFIPETIPATIPDTKPDSLPAFDKRNPFVVVCGQP
ncbi:hypothetical protein CH330_03325, partial [candidate division WOR-3 bacterium JGI_Cruoil_03_51_56]